MCLVPQLCLTLCNPMDYRDPAFDSFGYILRNEITGSYVNSIFNFLRNLHTVFQSSYTILHQQWTRFLISSHSCQHLLFPVFAFCFFYSGHSNVYKEASCVVMICISLMFSDVEHLYLCLLAICISSMEKCIFKTLVQFSIELLVLLLLSFKISLNILDINQLWDTWF